MLEYPHAVALVPGFLGFDHRGDYTYFADRLIAGLRACLTSLGAAEVPVVPTSTLPISSLAERQTELLKELRILELGDQKKRPGIGKRTWHLIGHSTGGVDAAMLLREHSLKASDKGSVFSDVPFSRTENAELVARVQSVVSVSAPHFGTALALSPLSELLQGDASLAGVKELAAMAVDVFRRDAVKSRLGFAQGVLATPSDLPSFLFHLLAQNDLAKDLRPEVVGALSNAALRTDRANRLSFIMTVAP